MKKTRPVSFSRRPVSCKIWPIVADLRYEAGDIDLLEKNSLISRFADVNTSLSRMEDDLSISRNNLKILLLVQDDLMPADSVLVMYALKKNRTICLRIGLNRTVYS